jgi:hypothetical protein
MPPLAIIISTWRQCFRLPPCAQGWEIVKKLDALQVRFLRFAVFRFGVDTRFAALRPVLRAFLRRAAGAPAARAPVIERIIDATAASAAAIAAAVAARTATFSIRAAVFLARPATLRCVLCTKLRLRLAITISKGFGL